MLKPYHTEPVAKALAGPEKMNPALRALTGEVH